MKILLLSPYDAPSHAYWRAGLCRHLAEYEWTCLTLPARHFSWRIRGNSLTWGIEQKSLLERQYDLIVATSMTDLATLRGLVPALAAVPTLLYFHENQFEYPKSSAQHPSVEPQMVSLYAALCAQRLVFNSAFNRRTFLQGVADLLQRLPDCVPAGVVDQLAGKSQVVPVPLEPVPRGVKSAGPVKIVWNHRWEYDKGPELLLAGLQQLPTDLPVQFHVLGQQFRQSPAEFTQIKALLQKRGWLGHWGYLESRDDYIALLGQSHIVLSTAHHDFQGLAVLEAVSAGCVPVVPDRLAYPEWFASAYRFGSDRFSRDSFGAAAAENLSHLLTATVASLADRPAPDIAHLTWDHLRSTYITLLQELGGRGVQGRSLLHSAPG